MQACREVRRQLVVCISVACLCVANDSSWLESRYYQQELISRLDSRTLPLKPRHRCTSSVLRTCLRNDVLASCLLTKHPRWRDSYTRPTIWSIDRPHLQWSWTIRFRGNASTLNIVIFVNHTWRQRDNANIRGKNYKIKVRMSLTVRLQARHRPTSKKLHTPY